MRKLTVKISCLLILGLLLLPAGSFALSIGDKAPAFTTPSSLGEISLADYAGEKNIVLALYFAVFSSV